MAGGGLYGDRMRNRSPLLAGSVTGFAGIVLLLLESLRTLFGTALGTVSTVLLFVGLGLVVVGGALLVVALSWNEPAPPEEAVSDG